MAYKKNRPEQIADITQYIAKIHQLFTDWSSAPGDLWFRGVDNSKFTLVPRTVRIKNYDEESPTEEFLQNFQVYHTERVSDCWERYALMQHFGLPTRLLDWSKSPLVALYFALENRPPKKQAVVWAMDPYKFNEIAHGKAIVYIPHGHAHIQDGIPIGQYLPLSLRLGELAKMPIEPLAIEPPLMNKRIVAQQGCFTIHGSNQKPIEQYFIDAKIERITRFIIPARARAPMLDALYNLGIREDTIYQDLNSLTRRICKDRVEN